MKSLLCSDVHDHIAHFESALMVASTANCDSILFCGDLCSPFMLDVYHDLCELPLHGVFGNNDGDRFHLYQKADNLNRSRKADARIQLHGEFLLAGKNHALNGIPPSSSIAVYHYPDVAAIMAASGRFDVVCCGHSHKSMIEKMEHSVLINPGSIMGYVPGGKTGGAKPSCAIINWNSGELDLIEL